MGQIRLIRFSILLLLCFHCMYASAQNPYKKFSDSLISLLPAQKEDSVKALLLFNIARMKMGEAQNSGNWDEAIRWSKMFLGTSQKAGYPFGIRRSHWMLGTCWSQKGNYAEAAYHFNTGLQYAYKDNNKAAIIAFAYNLARTYVSLGNYEEALKNHLAAYNVLQELKEEGPTTLQQLSLNIAKVYAKLHKYPEALEWSRKALPEDTAIFYQGQILLFIASVQMEMNQRDEALKNLHAALRVFPDRFNRKPENEYTGILGEWYMDYGDAWLKVATLSTGSERTTAYREAIKQLNKSISLLMEGSGGRETLMNAYDLLRHACEAVDDYQNALRYTRLYMGIRDSIYNKQTYLKFADQRLQFEREKAAVEEKARLEKVRWEDEVLRRKLLDEQKLENERQLTYEKLNYERQAAAEKLRQQAAIAEEKAKHERIVALQKQEQVRLQLEKKRMNNLVLLGSMAIFVVAVLLLLLHRQRTVKKRAVERAEAIHRMAELELQSLRSQLNPHFMFNSLNSIQELILMEENEKSHSYLARFSKLLRMLLENAEKPFIPLQKELEFLQLYLGLESLRVPDLQYAISVAPQLNAEETLIPNMILQPYIENAIWHGLSHKTENKQLQVRIYRENGTVNYEIEDNGVGRKKAAELKSLFRQKHNSKGMELLSKRFKLLNKEYSSEITTSITDVIDKEEVAGTLVTIKVPVNAFTPQLNYS